VLARVNLIARAFALPKLAHLATVDGPPDIGGACLLPPDSRNTPMIGTVLPPPPILEEVTDVNGTNL
jgi:hypothetical protein